MKVEIPPEIINNIGTLHFKLGDMEKAKVSYYVANITVCTVFCDFDYSFIQHNFSGLSKQYTV